jgi:hypothetical protein
MDYVAESHNNGEELIKLIHPKLWRELADSFDAITDADLRTTFQKTRDAKSLAPALNLLVGRELLKRHWKHEAPIFNSSEYKKGTRWRLDFAKKDGKKSGVAVEVAFNHGEAIAWNLLKPVLSSQLNHVKKQIQTDMGVIITVTSRFRKSGGFDNSTGTLENFSRYLIPLSGILTVPIVLIGLESDIVIEHYQRGHRKIGRIL